MSEQDHELLQLAAKAAGVPHKEIINWYQQEQGFFICGRAWNPLTDDGDALRLAVKLRMPLWFDDHATVCNQRECGDTGWRAETGIDDLGGYAATRRAIVRAAAEIGRAMS